MNRTALILLAVAGAAWFAYSHWDRHAPRPADGVLVGTPPVLSGLSWEKYTAYRPFVGDSQFIHKREADITARVLARKKYAAEGIRLDLVLGWGKMSDNRVLDHLKIRQAERSYEIIPDNSAPIALEEAYKSSINLSLVTLEPRHVVDEYYSIRVGDIVRLVGLLIHIKDAQGNVWAGGSVNDKDKHRQRVGILRVGKLQINDRKVRGNWEDNTPPKLTVPADPQEAILAGYAWAMDNGVMSEAECTTGSPKFLEGCRRYVKRQQ